LNSAGETGVGGSAAVGAGVVGGDVVVGAVGDWQPGVNISINKTNPVTVRRMAVFFIPVPSSNLLN
jgi:hypothetical protein